MGGHRGSPRQVSRASRGSDSPLTGIAFKVASVTVFVGMSTAIKAAGQVPTGEVVFFRSFFAMIPVLAFLTYRGEFRGGFRTKRPFSHFARGLVGVTSMGLGFYGLARLPLPESITINYAQPLLVVVFSALLLRETIRIYRWSAVVVGLIGVFIVSWPKLTLLGGGGLGGHEAAGAIATLCAAAASAFAMILVRSLVHTEKTATIVLWFSLSATLLSLLTLPFGWVALTAEQAGLLVMAGICGGVAQLLMTQSYRYAEASVVAPFEYTSMILAIIAGFVVFGDVPTIHMLVGGAIVVGAGLFIILRERQLGIERAAAKTATPPQ
nr:DMT family transporter [Pseudaminobacter soli]